MFRTLILGLMVVVVSATSVNAQSLRINVYSQRDAKWKNDRMGSSSLKVGDYGCLMTCLAAALRTTPGDLNGFLNRSGGYDSNGLLKHDVAASFDGSGGLKYIGRSRLPSNWSAVGRGIGRGAVYVVASRRPLGSSTHWVLVYKTTRGQAYYMDPWDGTVRRVGDGWVSFNSDARLYSFR
ncbi:hypothetical protein [Aporhodopirellula aestuarii]|uniref:Peptidase C39-like domain-containing protein n=1 Tax=Aporhodopirellula aestuarii TaxID=2950107 RepID=A0ABT0UDN3_9BACT|nr:hypothetical protein [Aporhodopirellula aestuarii]MCM2374575.1 hypothetical protein [Aporhodopirellula aestuarii]